MELIVIGNDADLAVRAIDAGVDRCLIDLESRGKMERQRRHHTFISDHSLTDVASMRTVLPPGALEVRVDAVHEGSRAQIDAVVDAGADMVMAPMVESVTDAQTFVDLVAGRARTCLLVETVVGIGQLPTLVAVAGVDEVHIGLNDLMISRGADNLFSPLVDGTLDDPARRVRAAGLGLGIGGVTAPGVPGLPALPVDPDRLIGELVRLDVTLAWLGRSFRAAVAASGGDVTRCVRAIRDAERHWRRCGPVELAANHDHLAIEVERAAMSGYRNPTG